MEPWYRESPVVSVISDKCQKLQRSRQISGICAFPKSNSQSYFWKNRFTSSKLCNKSSPKSAPVNPSAFHQHFSVSAYLFPIHTLPPGNQPGIFYPGSSSDLHLHHFLPNTEWPGDMLPPLKSQILKWRLLAQWLYWAKYLQAILACPAILLPGHGHVFLLSNCPDTDSLCCQHPSCLFTDIDRCISISVHLISTRAAVYSFG